VKALWKTIAGDSRNLAVVAALVVVAFLFCSAGHAREAAFVIPALALAGVAWLGAR
jgi:hypothetical protein